MTITDERNDAPGGPAEDPRGSRGISRLVRTFGIGCIVLAVGLLGARFLLSAAQPHAWAGTAFPEPLPAASMASLQIDTGEPADLSAYRGDAVVLYFGYTYCPDVCPTTLARLGVGIDALGDDADRVHAFMVSVDPARDPLEQLADYVRHFGDGFAGIGGSEADIAEVASLYGIYYELQEPDDNGFYLVDHTATLLGIDPDGNLKVVWDPTVTSDQLTADLEELLS